MLIGFNSARVFLKAANSRSATEKELPETSTELNQLGPVLSDASDASRAAASPCRPRLDSGTHDKEAAPYAQDEDRVRDF